MGEVDPMYFKGRHLTGFFMHVALLMVQQRKFNGKEPNSDLIGSTELVITARSKPNLKQN